MDNKTEKDVTQKKVFTYFSIDVCFAGVFVGIAMSFVRGISSREISPMVVVFITSVAAIFAIKGFLRRQEIEVWIQSKNFPEKLAGIWSEIKVFFFGEDEDYDDDNDDDHKD